MRGPTPHLLLRSAAAHHRCHGKTRICSIFGSDSPGSYFKCSRGNAPATKPAPPAQIPPPRSAQHLVPDVPIPLALPGGTGCGCLPSRHRACLQGWREKKVQQARGNSRAGQTASSEPCTTSPGPGVSPTQPCPAPAADTAQPTAAGISKAQPSLLPAHRDTFLALLISTTQIINSFFMEKFGGIPPIKKYLLHLLASTMDCFERKAARAYCRKCNFLWQWTVQSGL